MNKEFQSDEILRIDTQVRSELFGGTAATLEFGREKYTPDATKGYAKFVLAHPFPVLCERGCFHIGTIANSWESMRHQGFNYDHRVKEYYAKESNIEDRYIGCILACEFPPRPMGGWQLGDVMKSQPGITCVASVFKKAQGLNRIIGEHQTARHEWTVSLEVDHNIDEAGVVMFGNAEKFKALTKGEQSLLDEETPGDFAKEGFSYVPLAAMADELAKYWNAEERRFDKPWKGRRLHMMFGGLNGRVHFKGAGLVRYGAEPTAKLEQLLASASGGCEPHGQSDEPDASTLALMEIARALGNVEVGK